MRTFVHTVHMYVSLRVKVKLKPKLYLKLLFLCCVFQRSVENPSAVPVSKQTAAHGDAHSEHDGRGEPARVCANSCVLV